MLSASLITYQIAGDVQSKYLHNKKLIHGFRILSNLTNERTIHIITVNRTNNSRELGEQVKRAKSGFDSQLPVSASGGQTMGKITRTVVSTSLPLPSLALPVQSMLVAPGSFSD